MSSLLGIGLYTATEAALLLRTPARNIRRWLGGYSYSREGRNHQVPPLWQSDLRGSDDDELELSFRDLIELRFVKAFLDQGLGLKTVRHSLAYARQCVERERPFSSNRFRTDGRTIFLESLELDTDAKLLDLRRRQYVFKTVIERTFRDLDIEEEDVARWRPYKGKPSIVVDPHRAFGQPIVSAAGVPTEVLADAVRAEGSASRAAQLFEVSLSAVNDAVRFETELRAA